MAGVPEQPELCHYQVCQSCNRSAVTNPTCAQWLATEATLLISVLSLFFMAIENFKGLKSVVNYDLCCTKFRITTISLLTWAVSLGLVIAQHVNQWGPDFCPGRRQLEVWPPYHSSIAVALLVLPTLLSILYFSRAMLTMKRYRLQMEENPSSQLCYLTDEGILSSNAAVYVLFVLMWLPLCICALVSVVAEPVGQEVADWVWWIALANSTSYSYLYAFTNPVMGETFVKLLYYCCCKSHVSFARKGPGEYRNCIMQMQLAHSSVA